MIDILFVGRPSPEKGLTDLLWALANCVTDGWRLCVVGEIAGVDSALDDIDGAVKDRVFFAGPKTNLEVAALMRRADIVVVPSRYETFGNVALEAMASGCVVVAARTGGLADLLCDGVTGFHFPPGDRDCLARLMDGIIAQASALREVRAAAAREARAYAWPVIAAKTASVIQRVIGCGC